MADKPASVGVRVPRVEDRRFLLGRGRYVDDLTLPGTLAAVFARSLHAHARVLRLDGERARALPGVVAVVTAADLGDVKPLRVEPTEGARAAHIPLLATDRVRYVGQPVAVVVATDPYLAADAAEAVAVDYEALPAVVNAELAAGTEDNVLFRASFDQGDVSGAFAAAHVVVEETVRHPRVTGIPMETRGCLAAYDAATEQLTLWSSTQWPHVLRTWIADCLGIPESRTRVVAPDVGGGFGIKCHVFSEEVVIAALARRLGRPIKWNETRRENVLASVHAREQTIHGALAVARDGTLLGLRARIYVNVGAHPVFPWGAGLEPAGTARMLPGPYRIRGYAFEALGVSTNRTPTGSYRGVSYPVSTLVMETLIDRAAQALGIDPVEIRRKNLIAKDEFPYTSVAGGVYDPGSYGESLERALALLDYPSLRSRQRALRSQHRWLGIGLACYCEPTGMGARGLKRRGVVQVSGDDMARVRIETDGTVTAAVGASTQGQGIETSLAQIVSETLSVPLAAVTVLHGDTSLAPHGMGAFGSRTAVNGGGAVLAAATAVREKVLRIAAGRLEAGIDDLVLADGRVFVRGAPASALALGEIAGPGLEATESYDPPAITYSNATHAAVVEVDPETGRSALLQYVVVEDCGRMLNPLIVDGQVHGGVAQGVGAALHEELVYDEAGQPLTASLMEYHVPAAGDLPPIVVEHLETPSPWTAMGVKGMGEGGTIGATAAVARAVADALAHLGIRGLALPLTSGRIFGEMQRRSTT